jgi:thioesterase domain-containing protein
MVPGLGGGVIGFYDLAKYLDPDQPFYGLQAKGFDGGSSPLCSVEEMAAHYIKEMCACFPEGPYLLGGHSLGGRIAVEMAIQLQNKGRCVALVALLDTQPNIRRFGNWYQRIFLSVSHLAGDFLERVTYHAQNILSSTPKAMLSYLQKFFMNQIEKIHFRKSVVLNSDQNTNDHKLPEHIQILRQAMRIADRNYMLKKYPDKLTLFRAEEQVVGLSGKEKYDRQYGWQNYAEDVDVYIVPGDHNTLLKEPNVKVLARTIQDCIDRVLADK